MNYLTQYITESQLLYPTVFKAPIDVMSHLLFTIGNGVEFIDGNPCIIANFNKTIYFKDYYRDAKSFSDCYEYYQKYIFDNTVKREFEEIKRFNSRYSNLCANDKSDTVLYDEAFNNITATLNSIQPVDAILLFDIDYWYQQISNQEFLPILLLSSNYRKMPRVMPNSEDILLKCTIAIIEAYLKFFKEFNDDMLVKYEYPFGSFEDTSCLPHKESIYKTFDEEITILEAHLLDITI